MFDRYQTGTLATLTAFLAAIALAAFGILLAAQWNHPGGYAITATSLVSLKLFRDLFQRKEAR